MKELGTEFQQILEKDIRKNIAYAFISLEYDLKAYPPKMREEILEKKKSQMKSEINDFIDRFTGSVELTSNQQARKSLSSNVL